MSSHYVPAVVDRVDQASKQAPFLYKAETKAQLNVESFL